MCLVKSSNEVDLKQSIGFPFLLQKILKILFRSNLVPQAQRLWEIHSFFILYVLVAALNCPSL